MLLKSFVRTGTLLAGARAFAPLAVQRRTFTKMSAAPIGVMVTVEIEEARVPAFLEALKVDAAGSREEEGCLRFDLLKDSEAANTWHFYEIYKNDEAMAVHKTLPHYKAWADFKARFAASFVCLLVFVARRGLARRAYGRGDRAERLAAARRRRDQSNAGRRRRRVAEGGQVHGRRLHGLSELSLFSRRRRCPFSPVVVVDGVKGTGDFSELTNSLT